MPLKKTIAYIAFSFFIFQCNAQYYLRGEIKNEKNEYLQNVKILLHSDKLVYRSGNSGGFGISSKKQEDSVTLSQDGYETATYKIVAGKLAELTMKVVSSNASKLRPKLISVTKDLSFKPRTNWFVGDESYFSIVENETVNAEKYPNTGFSLNINKASYSNIRRFLSMKSVVPPDAVRIEELLNYFNLNYKEPTKGEYFGLESHLSQCPWNAEKRLFYVNINAKKLDLNKIPPSNLVFLIDASGSMELQNRLPLVKAAFQMLVKNLRPIDTVSIVIYGGGTVSVWMQPTGGSEKLKILQSIEELVASGDTPGESAIKLAYQVARSTFIKNGNNRVILATDGDFNVGETSEKAMDELITRERQSGVYLTCLGVGMGNFKDSKLETLAKRGNGNYAYLDDIREAEKVLVTELTQTFYSVADNCFLNVHFNPTVVKDYRLIGFDNKRDAVADSSGALEGGEIGSGNSVMAVFEVTPQVNDDAAINQVLQQQSIADIKLSYITSDTKQTKDIKYQCNCMMENFDSLSKDLRFATAVTMFGLKLRQSKYIKSKEDWDQLQQISIASHNPNDYLQKEFVAMVETAKSIYAKAKSKKKKKKHEDDEEN